MIRSWISTYGQVHAAVEQLLNLEWTAKEIYTATREAFPVECKKHEWTLDKGEQEEQLERLLTAQRVAVSRIKNSAKGGGGSTTTPKERVLSALKKLDDAEKLVIFTSLAEELGYEIS